MRTTRKLSLFGILGLITVVLFLIGISFMQAQVQVQKKPQPPPEDTWAVQLPVSDDIDTMLYGDGAMYINDDNKVRIKVEKGSSRLRKGQTAFYYYFSFKLVNSTSRKAGFQNVFFDDYVTYPDDGPLCIFPDGCGNDPETCMECFLNQDQPHPEYEYFNLKFQVGQHSFTEALNGLIIEGIEDENWDYNFPVKFICNSDWIKIRLQNQEDFSDPYSEYHNVECDERNYDDGDSENMNIWIVKLDKDVYTSHYETITGCDGVWRIYIEGEDLWMQEQYTRRAEGKEKKGGTNTVTVVPLEAVDDFYFYIDFIKNPS